MLKDYDYTWVTRHAGKKSRDFYRPLIDNPAKGEEMIDIASVGFQGAAYIAVACPQGVKALVSLQAWRPDYWDNFGYRILPEWHHYSSLRGCPQRILEILSPPELLYTDAAQQKRAVYERKRAWEEIEERKQIPSVPKGSLVEFTTPLTFTDGYQAKILRLMYGTTFAPIGDAPHSRYKIPRWRRAENWKVLKALPPDLLSSELS